MFRKVILLEKPNIIEESYFLRTFISEGSIKGFKVKARVRWRLVPWEWEIKEVKNGFLATRF